MAKDPAVLINVALCAVITLRLMFFRKPGARHSWWASWLAYLLILAYGSIPIKFAFSEYSGTHIETLIVNLAMLALVIRARGNAAKLFSRKI
jgi:hypothetical protein